MFNKKITIIAITGGSLILATSIATTAIVAKSKNINALSKKDVVFYQKNLKQTQNDLALLINTTKETINNPNNSNIALIKVIKDKINDTQTKINNLPNSNLSTWSVEQLTNNINITKHLINEIKQLINSHNTISDKFSKIKDLEQKLLNIESSLKNQNLDQDFEQYNELLNNINQAIANVSSFKESQDFNEANKLFNNIDQAYNDSLIMLNQNRFNQLMNLETQANNLINDSLLEDEETIINNINTALKQISNNNFNKESSFEQLDNSILILKPILKEVQDKRQQNLVAFETALAQYKNSFNTTKQELNDYESTNNNKLNDSSNQDINLVTNLKAKILDLKTKLDQFEINDNQTLTKKQLHQKELDFALLKTQISDLKNNYTDLFTNIDQIKVLLQKLQNIKPLLENENHQFQDIANKDDVLNQLNTALAKENVFKTTLELTLLPTLINELSNSFNQVVLALENARTLELNNLISKVEKFIQDKQNNNASIIKPLVQKVNETKQTLSTSNTEENNDKVSLFSRLINELSSSLDQAITSLDNSLTLELNNLISKAKEFVQEKQNENTSSITQPLVNKINEIEQMLSSNHSIENKESYITELKTVLRETREQLSIHKQAIMELKEVNSKIKEVLTTDKNQYLKSNFFDSLTAITNEIDTFLDSDDQSNIKEKSKEWSSRINQACSLLFDEIDEWKQGSEANASEIAHKLYEYGIDVDTNISMINNNLPTDIKLLEQAKQKILLSNNLANKIQETDAAYASLDTISKTQLSKIQSSLEDDYFKNGEGLKYKELLDKASELLTATKKYQKINEVNETKNDLITAFRAYNQHTAPLYLALRNIYNEATRYYNEQYNAFNAFKEKNQNFVGDYVWKAFTTSRDASEIDKLLAQVAADLNSNDISYQLTNIKVATANIEASYKVFKNNINRSKEIFKNYNIEI